MCVYVYAGTTKLLRKIILKCFDCVDRGQLLDPSDKKCKQNEHELNRGIPKLIINCDMCMDWYSTDDSIMKSHEYTRRVPRILTTSSSSMSTDAMTTSAAYESIAEIQTKISVGDDDVTTTTTVYEDMPENQAQIPRYYEETTTAPTVLLNNAAANARGLVTASSSSSSTSNADEPHYETTTSVVVTMSMDDEETTAKTGNNYLGMSTTVTEGTTEADYPNATTTEPSNDDKHESGTAGMQCLCCSMLSK